MKKIKKEALLLDEGDEDDLTIKVNEEYAARFEVCCPLVSSFAVTSRPDGVLIIYHPRCSTTSAESSGTGYRRPTQHLQLSSSARYRFSNHVNASRRPMPLHRIEKRSLISFRAPLCISLCCTFSTFPSRLSERHSKQHGKSSGSKRGRMSMKMKRKALRMWTRILRN
jgi:hypothetical protein